METIDTVLARLERLNEIGASLSRERDILPLLERILLAAKSITNADGGTLYRMTEDGTALRFEILRTDSLNIAMGGSATAPINFSNLPLRNADGALTTRWWRLTPRSTAVLSTWRTPTLTRPLIFWHPALRPEHRLSVQVIPDRPDEGPRRRSDRGLATA